MYKTIAALATAPGLGGIAIVRVSGPGAETVLSRLFRRADGKKEWVSHQLCFGRIEGASGETLDEAMAVLMRAPRSYTREDVAELHCHGGDAVSRQVLEEIFALGVRPAGPGEFTRRAFENGRIDLSQAEAAMRLIGAQGEAETREALRQMSGAVSRGIRQAQEKITEMLAEIAACTDFPDEVEETPTAQSLLEKGEKLAQWLRQSCDARRGRVLEQGLDVVIAGRPNVGKSSLLNALVGEERAIVTARAGTTRDVVKASVLLEGVRVNLTDTAGLREAEDEAETIGVQRARKAMENADLLLIVLDASMPLCEEDRQLLEETKDRRRLVICNKSDLDRALDVPCDLTISAQTSQGLEELRAFLRQEAAGSVTGSGALLTQARHVEAAQRAAGRLDEMAQTLRQGMPVDFAAVDARGALGALGEITGENAEEQVVDEVFRSFCVGK